MMLFDIGANRGDASFAALRKGFDKIIALEPAPRIYKELVKNFIYSPVIPIRMAVSQTNNEHVEFYEADEDGLSTLNKDWLTAAGLPYGGRPFRTIKVTTITVDKLAELYGHPDLIKIDVEGAEWSVFRGMTRKYGVITFEWTAETLSEHQQQLGYLSALGYTQAGPQFIEHHLQQPKDWYSLDEFRLSQWVSDNELDWKAGGWKNSGLRATADVGMVWVR